MNHSERNRELLKRIQQKAEALRETRDSNDQFETELEAVQEVYGRILPERLPILFQTDRCCPGFPSMLLLFAGSFSATHGSVPNGSWMDLKKSSTVF